jgi:F-type H+-transporting ATPase subunit gamma
MAGLKETKKRIRSVKNTQKITRAMKLVSSAKYGRSYGALQASKSYRQTLLHALEAMVPSIQKSESLSAFFAERSERHVLVVVCCTDRGLCGGLNSSLLKEVASFCAQKKAAGVRVSIELFGKKSSPLVARGVGDVLGQHASLGSTSSSADSSARVRHWVRSFECGQWDGVYVAFPEFKNIMSQRPSVERLLPQSRASKNLELTQGLGADVLLEPSSEEFMREHIIDVVANSFYRVMLETIVAEHAARMTAMDSATSNADKVIKDLTLQYNRARQAAITKELIEITSGAEAL